MNKTTSFSSKEIKDNYKKFTAEGDRFQKTIDFIERIGVNESKILSVGSGFGQLEGMLFDKGARTVIGIEKEASMVDSAKSNFVGPQFYQSSAEDIVDEYEKYLNLPDCLDGMQGKFDLFILSFVILNIKEEAILDKLFRLAKTMLKKDGKIFVSTIHPDAVCNHETDCYEIKGVDNTLSNGSIYTVKYKKPAPMEFQNTYWDMDFLRNKLELNNLYICEDKKTKLYESLTVSFVVAEKM